jgi:hypothetical protein
MSPSWDPSQRDAPPPEPSFIHLSNSPVYDPPHIPCSPRHQAAVVEVCKKAQQTLIYWSTIYVPKSDLTSFCHLFLGNV